MKKIISVLALISSVNLLASKELVEAAKAGDIDEVQKRLDAGDEVDFLDEGKSALMWAAIQGHFEVANLLLEKGAQVDLVDSLGNTIMMRAAQAGHPKIVRLLIAQGAKKGHNNELAQSAISLALINAEKNQDANAKENFAMVAKYLMVGNPSDKPAVFTEKDKQALSKLLGQDAEGVMAQYQKAVNALPMLITTTVEDNGKRTMPPQLTQMIISYLDADDTLQLVAIHPAADNRISITKLNPEAVKGALKAFGGFLGGQVKKLQDKR